MAPTTPAPQQSDAALETLRDQALHARDVLAAKSHTAWGSLKSESIWTAVWTAVAVFYPPWLVGATAFSLWGASRTVGSWAASRRWERQAEVQERVALMSPPELLGYVQERNSTTDLVQRARPHLDGFKQRRLGRALIAAGQAGLLAVGLVNGWGEGLGVIIEVVLGARAVGDAVGALAAHRTAGVWERAIANGGRAKLQELVEAAEHKAVDTSDEDEDEDEDEDTEELDHDAHVDADDAHETEPGTEPERRSVVSIKNNMLGVSITIGDGRVTGSGIRARRALETDRTTETVAVAAPPATRVEVDPIEPTTDALDAPSPARRIRP